jgi:hypothetical protein
VNQVDHEPEQMLGIDSPAAGGWVLGLLSLDDRTHEGEKAERSDEAALVRSATEHQIPPDVPL